jgi:hypothetical protein
VFPPVNRSQIVCKVNYQILEIPHVRIFRNSNGKGRTQIEGV